MRKIPARDVHAYEKHRERVKAATYMIDNSGPQLAIGNLLPITKLKTDGVMFMRIAKRNRQLLIQQNCVLRTRGFINTFPVRLDLKLGEARMVAVHKRIAKIEEQNIAIGKRILCTKGELNTRRPTPPKTTPDVCEYESFTLPEQIIAKYSHLKLPPTKQLQHQLLRPKIYLEVAVQNMRPLGRITIQLYTEASPQVVLEFARTCASHSKEKLNFVRLFPSLWLEGELTLDEDSRTCRNLEYDMRALDHDTAAGVLSFSTRYVKGFKDGYLNFSLSFKPLRVLNGKRVAFGQVVRGLRLLDCIQDYGTKNGKPTKQIIVTECGMQQ